MQEHLSFTTFQIIRCFGLSRFIYFVMHLDIHYVKYIVKAAYLKRPKCLIIWNRGGMIYDIMEHLDNYNTLYIPI